VNITSNYVKLKNLYVSNKVKELDINCTSAIDFSNVHANDVKLYCSLISNVDSLKNIKTLSLMACIRIVDVSPLKNVHKLSLTDMYNITDVSSLKNVHDLSLCGLDSVTDVSMLKNHTLSLSNMHGVKDVSSLGSIHDLIINELPITSVEGLENVENLGLINLRNIDISMLKNKCLIIQNVTPPEDYKSNVIHIDLNHSYMQMSRGSFLLRYE